MEDDEAHQLHPDPGLRCHTRSTESRLDGFGVCIEPDRHGLAQVEPLQSGGRGTHDHLIHPIRIGHATGHRRDPVLVEVKAVGAGDGGDLVEGGLVDFRRRAIRVEDLGIGFDRGLDTRNVRETGQFGFDRRGIPRARGARGNPESHREVRGIGGRDTWRRRTGSVGRRRSSPWRGHPTVR